MDLMDKEYIHIGTNKIYKELWQNIYMDPIYKDITKPYGGLWCSRKNDNICDWLSYVKLEKPNYYKSIVSKPSSLIKFKNNSKLLRLENKNDLLNFKDSNFFINISDNPIIVNKFYYSYKVQFIPDYEKISKNYDLLYINPRLNNSFKEYSIDTMLVLNPNSILYYKPIEIDINNNCIKNIYKKKVIAEPQSDYYKYVEYLKEKFFRNETNLNELNLLKNEIINNRNNLYDYLKYNINSDIDSKKLLEVIVNNICNEIMVKQKVLHK